MPDREKVLNDLDVLKRYLINYSPAFFEQAVNKQVFSDSLTDAIALLKEQEDEIAFLKKMQLQTVHNMREEDIGEAVARILNFGGR